MIDSLPQRSPSSHWIGSSPSENVTALERRVYKLNLLSTISFIAITAIALTVLAASFFLSGTTTAISLSLLFPVMATPCFARVSSQCQMKSLALQSILDRERPVALAFEKIKHWQESEISAFLSRHEIPLPPNIHLPDLLPLIARFEVRSQQIQTFFAESTKLLHSIDLPDRDLRLMQRNIGWNIKERKLIPSALESAFVLQKIGRAHV